jgi:hypothetical protein
MAVTVDQAGHDQAVVKMKAVCLRVFSGQVWADVDNIATSYGNRDIFLFHDLLAVHADQISA